MICAHPQCTGVHGTDKPEAVLCPRVIARKRERNREWMTGYNHRAAGMLAGARYNAHRRGTR